MENENQPIYPVLSIPGLDTNLGLHYTNESPTLYRKILHRFFDQYGIFEKNFNNMYQAGDIAAATILAHSLKSASGTIGAVTLQKNSQQLETACRHDINEIDTHLPMVIAELNIVIANLNIFFAETDPK